MEILYFLSDAAGDIPVGTESEKQPFLTSPTEKHPFLTLGAYFKAISKLICQDNCAAIKNALPSATDQTNKLADVTKIIIRSEKHGALYHIASAELFFPDAPPLKLALTTAITEANKPVLGREYEILRRLNSASTAPCFPEIYGLHEKTCRVDNQTETLLIMIGEWLNNFHEWHVTTDNSQKNQRIRLWDQNKGHCDLSVDEAAELIKQAAGILTRSYDIKSFQQIYPWHHAAGDFVVKRTNTSLLVKLITARNYGPMQDFDPEDDQAPLMALLPFFINLSIRMRLDRRDGVAEPVWLQDFAVEATIKGFKEALHDKTLTDQELIGGRESFMELLASFNKEELLQICQPLLDIYRHEDEEDFELIRARLDRHCDTVKECLQY